MSKDIKNQIKKIAQKHHIHIVYAVESGSRVWGFSSKESDYDIRFIYHYHYDEYLRLQPPTRVIDQTDGLYDFHGWDIYKACHLFQKGNPSMNEWLHSPIVYQNKKNFAASLRKLLSHHFPTRKAGFHYLHMIRKNVEKKFTSTQKISSKSLLYIFRAILCLQWLDQYDTQPPIPINQLLNLNIPKNIKSEIIQLIDRQKFGNEKDIYQPSEDLIVYIHEQINLYSKKVLLYPSRQITSDMLDEIILKIIK